MRSVFALLLAPLAALARPLLEQRSGSATVISNCKGDKEWAISLDDGPYIYLQDILKLAKQYGAHMTLMNNGLNYDCIYDHADDLQDLYRSGLFEFGSHMWLHNDATMQTSAEFISNLTKLDQAYTRILGVTANLHRFPYGSENSERLKDLYSYGIHQTILWSVDSGDTLGKSVSQQKQILDDAIAKGDPVISLQHSPKPDTVHTVLPYLLKQLAKTDYKIVPLSQCVGVQPYRTNTGVLGTRDGSWVC